MIHREYYVDNAGYQELMKEYQCNECGLIMCWSWPCHLTGDNGHYCGKCAFKLGLIDGFIYAKQFCYSFNSPYYAEVINGDTHCYSKKEYEKKLKRIKNRTVDKRNSPEYKLFRKLVYERDDHRCQNCLKRGGELNAHHIKSYKKYPKLRLDISNGITLCKECHQKEHRRIAKNGST